MLNTTCFTRRATGYPGPGIITSDLRGYYFTFELRL
jgi:Fe(3+) dicitrate transport protein